MESGNVNNKPKTKTNWVRTELKIEALAKFYKDSHVSTRSFARKDGKPSPTTGRLILKVSFDFFSTFFLLLLCVVIFNIKQKKILKIGCKIKKFESEIGAPYI